MTDDDEARRRIERLWSDHADAVRAFAVFRVGRDRADDVTAETFLVAWRRRAELPDRPLPWLLGVARLVIANIERGRSRAVGLRSRLREAAEVAANASAGAQMFGCSPTAFAVRLHRARSRARRAHRARRAGLAERAGDPAASRSAESGGGEGR